MTPALIVVICISSGAAIALGVLLARAVSQREQVSGQRDQANERAAQLAVELASSTAANEARVEEINKARENLETQFKGVAAEVFETTQTTFLKQAKEQFDNQREIGNKDLELRQEKIQGILKPIGDSLKKFERQVSEMEEKRAGAYERLLTQVSQLHDDTVGLRSILSSSAARGKWGEQTLRNIIEMAGMREHIDFDEQVSTPGIGPDGGASRPDAVVHIPGGLEVVIDAKTPFDSYYESHNTEDTGKQETLLKDHAKAVLARAKELGDRDYSNLVEGSPDFVVMFVPTDPMLDAAIDVEPTLWETAWTKHSVLIATPGLLMAFLRTVAAAWQQQDLQANAQEITNEAVKLYNALRSYTGHIANVGKGLERAVKAHNDAIGSLETRVLPPARKLEDLGPASGQEKIDEVEYVETSVRSITKPELKGEPELEN